MLNKFIILGIIVYSYSFSAIYSVGDIISTTHQNLEYPVCYGDYEATNFKLSDLNGELNGGVFKVSLIDLSATWCGPCVSFIPTFDGIHNNWIENDGVFIFNSLMDMNQPYSCSQWGAMGTPYIPVIVNDGNGGGNSLFSFFNTGSAIPSTVFIDHEMRVQYMANQITYSQANNIIENMLDNCSMCGNPDFDNDFVLNDNDNCPNNYNPDQEDEDSDLIGDACDDCHNLAGDPSDDLLVNITDILIVVHLISQGGMDSDFHSNCEKTDADYTNDNIINVLDIVQMINQILGNTALNSQIQNTANIEYSLANNKLKLLINSNSNILGFQIDSKLHISKAKLIQNIDKEFIFNDKSILGYSLENIPFENNRIELDIEFINIINIDDINIVVSDYLGNAMNLFKSNNGKVISNGSLKFKLSDPYPNPFNPITELNFSLPIDSKIRLIAYNIQGQKVQEIFHGYKSMGIHKIVWDASNLTSGIYIIKLISEVHQATTQTILLK